MSIVGVRFDERLIHGQVVTFWTNSLKAERIVVLDEKAATDEIVKAALRMAVPEGVKSSIILKEKFAENYKAGKYGTQRLFIVFRDMDVLKYLVDEGIAITEVNLGNHSQKAGDTRISGNFCVSPHDVEVIRELEAKGVHFVARLTPQAEEQQADDLLKKAGL